MIVTALLFTINILNETSNLYTLVNNYSFETFLSHFTYQKKYFCYISRVPYFTRIQMQVEHNRNCNKLIAQLLTFTAIINCIL